MRNELKYIFLFLIITFSSCNFNANVTYENEELEKKDAESTTAMFYLFASRNEFEKTLDLFSNSFYEITTKKELEAFLTGQRNKLGEFKDYNLKDWKTNRVNGTNAKTEYFLVYNVEYTNGKVIEKITLVKEDGRVKICGYNVGEIIR